MLSYFGLVPAALTGYFPAGEKLRLAVHTQYPDNLFTMLAPSHGMHARESGTQLCPPRVCSGAADSADQETLLSDLWIVYQHIVLPKRWKSRLPSIQEGWTGFGEGQHAAASELVSDAEQMHRQMNWSARLQRLRGFLAEIQDLPANTFHYYHALLPHAPWTFLPDAQGAKVSTRPRANW